MENMGKSVWVVCDEMGTMGFEFISIHPLPLLLFSVFFSFVEGLDCGLLQSDSTAIKIS